MLENNGVRTDVAAWFPWVDTRGAMRCLSEWTEAFLRDGGVARTEPVLSGLRPSSAMAVWPGNPRESAGAGPDCADCSSRAEKHLSQTTKTRRQNIGPLGFRVGFLEPNWESPVGFLEPNPELVTQ